MSMLNEANKYMGDDVDSLEANIPMQDQVIDAIESAYELEKGSLRFDGALEDDLSNLIIAIEEIVTKVKGE